MYDIAYTTQNEQHSVHNTTASVQLKLDAQ
jgi:hypothetical protein